jgi:predicted nucleotidyltransferase
MGAQPMRSNGNLPEHVQTVLGKLRGRLESLYGERLVRLMLYGWQARGDAEPGSDIDVLVVLQGPVSSSDEIERTSDLLAELSLASGETVACVFMDEARFTRRSGPLLRNIRREGVRI